MSLYEFPSPGKAYKKVKAIKLSLTCSDGVKRDHSITVYLHAGASPSFCITLPADYIDTYVNHPPKREYMQNAIHQSFDRDARIVRAAAFDTAVNAVTFFSEHWREHHAERTMERCIYITLELVAPGVRISPPSFSSSETLVGLTVRWGYRVAGREYQHRNGIDDPTDPKMPTPAFNDLVPYSGRSSGQSSTLPFTAEAWRELLKIRTVLERAATQLAQLGNADTAQVLLASLANGVPLLSSS